MLGQMNTTVLGGSCLTWVSYNFLLLGLMLLGTQ